MSETEVLLFNALAKAHYIISTVLIRDRHELPNTGEAYILVNKFDLKKLMDAKDDVENAIHMLHKEVKCLKPS